MKVGAFLTIAGLALTLPNFAEAQTYAGGRPVCLQNYAPVQYIDCRYDSIPQCQASASGRAAQCIENPYFAAEAPAPRSRRQRER